MQPIQHRPSATNAPWLFRHIIHATIYHVVILLCAGFPRTFIRSVRQAFFMLGHILLLLFSTMNILCKYGANIFKAVRSIRHKYAFTVYHDWRNSIFALLIAHHKKANTLYNFAVIRKPRSSLSINLIIGNHVDDSISGCISIHKATELYQFFFIDVEKLPTLFFIPYNHIPNTKRPSNKCVWSLFFQPLPGCHRRIAGGRLSFICTLVILMMNQKAVLYLLCIGFCPMLMMHLFDLENSILVYHFTFSPFPAPPAYAIPVPAP